MTTTRIDVVIVGAGHGGCSLAAALRSSGYEGSIALISDEADYPYHRPPLSKAFMGNKGQEGDDRKLYLQNECFWKDNRIDLRLNAQAQAIEAARNVLLLSSGERLEYGHLVLATGSRARTLQLPGSDLEGVEVLRTLVHARRLRERLAGCNSVLVVGGGFIGLEVAATARQLGKEVRVLETASRLLERSVSPVTSEYILARHREKGINIELNACVESFVGSNGRVTGVQCGDRQWPADLVIVGAGAVPNSELAEAAGIACANGIIVDEQMRTSVPNIFAIGDCAAHENDYAGKTRIRLESIQNANDQARVVAQVLSGADSRYHSVPWFWSDQGDIRLQMVGLSIGRTDCVTRGDPAQGRFSVFHYRGDTLIAVDSINQPMDHINSRKLLSNGISPDKALIADPTTDLKQLLG